MKFLQTFKIKEIEIAHLKELINLERVNTSVGLNAILQYTIGEKISQSISVDFHNILGISLIKALRS